MTHDEADRLIAETRACHDQSNFPRLLEIAEQLIAYHGERSDRLGLAEAYRHRGTALHYLQDPAGAEEAYARSLDFAQRAGDAFLVAAVQVSLGNLAIEHHSDIAAGRTYHRLAEPVLRAKGDPRLLGILLGNLSEMDRVEGLYDDALRNAHEALDLFSGIADDTRAAWQSINLALIHLFRRDPRSTTADLAHARARLERTPNNYWTAMFFDVATMYAMQLSEFDHAAQFFGFVERWRDEHRVPRLYGLMSGWYPPVVERLVEAMDPQELDRFRGIGASLSLPAAHRLAAELRSGISRRG